MTKELHEGLQDRSVKINMHKRIKKSLAENLRAKIEVVRSGNINHSIIGTPDHSDIGHALTEFIIRQSILHGRVFKRVDLYGKNKSTKSSYNPSRTEL